MHYIKKKNVLSREKNAVVVNQIPRFFDTWMAQKGKTYNIQFWPSDLIQPKMTPHVLVFEGAGDILLGGSSKFQLLDLQKKYNSKVMFHPFSFTLTRKREPYTSEYDQFIASLQNILKTVHGKTLIVIWKDFKTGDSKDVPDEQRAQAPNDKYTKKLNDRLVAEGIADSVFTVTYYGASDSKSTNAYRDYDNIILAGRWGIGGSVIGNLQKAFFIQSPDMENYMLWYYTQLLLRIGIRNNNSGIYHVYYSQDHKDTFIERLKIYLNNNILLPKKIQANIPLWHQMVKRFKKGAYYFPEIKKLVDQDLRIGDAIETGTPYTISIPLRDIGVLIPKKKKLQADNYRSLKEFLRKVGVTLNITR